MDISKNGINLIKQFEGCVLTAYRCSAGVLTIGYGHTAGVKAGQRITQAQADMFLDQDIRRFVNHVNYFDKIYHFTQNQFDALVSFAFNIGSINQLTANGTRSISVIADKMLLYNKAGGKYNQGLMNRRTKERDLFLSNTLPNVVEAPQPTLRINCKGDKVKALQTILNKLFKAGLEVDGKYGKLTKSAVYNAQKVMFKDDPNEWDGIYGPHTYNAIKARL